MVDTSKIVIFVPGTVGLCSWYIPADILLILQNLRGWPSRHRLIM
jgi:hypothetical protein